MRPLQEGLPNMAKEAPRGDSCKQLSELKNWLLISYDLTKDAKYDLSGFVLIFCFMKHEWNGGCESSFYVPRTIYINSNNFCNLIRLAWG